jgi:hypothetical protein
VATVTYQKKDRIGTIDASHEHEPRLADEKDIDLGLPVARLVAIIGSNFAVL